MGQADLSRRARLVSGRRRLHWGSVQGGREAHLLPGAAVADPEKLFNSSLERNTRRAIDLHEGETINEAAFKQLIRSAVEANVSARENRKK